MINLVGPRGVQRIKRMGIHSTRIPRGSACDDMIDPRNSSRTHAHNRRANQRVLSARYVAADCGYRNVLLAKEDTFAYFTFKFMHAFQLALRKLRHLTSAVLEILLKGFW